MSSLSISIFVPACILRKRNTAPATDLAYLRNSLIAWAADSYVLMNSTSGISNVACELSPAVSLQ